MELKTTSRAWAKIAAVGLLIAALGLPINELWRYSLLLAGGLAIFSGRISLRPCVWLVAGVLVVLPVVQRLFFPVPLIEEGHNIFLVDRAGDAVEQGLPAGAYRLMAVEFNAEYPRDAGCRRDVNGCWRAQGRPNRTFAFSADGLLDRPAYSRRVATIDFSDPIWLRLGFINEDHYNWSSQESDVKRVRRDGRFWQGLHRWHLTMPWFVMYRLPQDFAGSTMCWRGDVIWEEADNQFRLLHHPQSECRAIGPDSIGRRIFGVAIRPDTLAMQLKPPLTVSLQQWFSIGLTVIAALSIMLLLVRWDRLSWRLPLLLMAASLVVVAIIDASFIGGLRPLDGGEDSLYYEGTARQAANDLRQGHVVAALRGGDDVFYFGGTSFRYFRVIERFLFGDTNLGYLTIILVFPLMMYAVFRRLLSVRWALALALIFVVVPIGRLFGTTFAHYAMFAVRGYADPLGVISGIAGYLLLIGTDAPRRLPTTRSAFFASLLFALSVVLRPNSAPFAAVMLTGAGLAMLVHRQWAKYVLFCLGFLPVILPGLHNWYFGGVFVPFTSNWSHPLALVMPPSAWLAALIDVVRLHWGSEAVAAALDELRSWLSGPTEKLAMVPVHVIAIVIVVDVMVRRAFEPWIRLTALAVLLLHFSALGFAVTPRYHFGAWLFTYLVVVVWIRESGAPKFRLSFPRRAEQISQSIFFRKTAGLLEDLHGLTLGRERPAA